ncbi:hypothetical protein F5Y15DRAFT_115310 [Xylariaceae sp. FL0016]|nr:hypothetical protein F5Y15DRAFT_115310 [Xylariaceae sp. FL0016]
MSLAPRAMWGQEVMLLLLLLLWCRCFISRTCRRQLEGQGVEKLIVSKDRTNKSGNVFECRSDATVHAEPDFGVPPRINISFFTYLRGRTGPTLAGFRVLRLMLIPAHRRRGDFGCHTSRASLPCSALLSGREG